MYAGGASCTLVGSNLGTSEFGFLPFDLDNPSGTAGFVPALFGTAMTASGLFDLWEISPDFATPSNTTITRISRVPVASFDTDLCSASRERCIPHSGSGEDLETLSGRLMHRLQIRDFGTHMSFVTSHTVDADGAPAGANGRAGIRWYELRSTDGGSTWGLFQEGTHAPTDGLDRWMPSIAMNSAGDIGIGYMVSAASMAPEIRVTGQTASSSGAGVFDSAEVICRTGVAGSDWSGRSGDYSATAVDPDRDTFWHTNQFGQFSSFGGWGTAVCEFEVVPAVTNQPSVVTITAPPDASIFDEGELIAFTATALDTEDGDISGGLSWSSDLDGGLGTGSGVNTSTLSVGTHSITASITDSGGAPGSDVIAVTIQSVTPGGPGGLETVVVSNVSSAGWTTVNLTGTYTSMVAVCTPVYANNTIPEVVRMRNASGSSFEIRLQNPSGSSLGAEEVHCLVIEEGAWQLPDGRDLEAQRYTSVLTDENDSWVGEAQSYLQSYTNPVVLGQVMTHNDASWSVFWDRGPSRTDPPSASMLYTGKHVGEDPSLARADEEIGFIVFEAGTGTLGGVPYEMALGSDDVNGIDNGPPDNYTFSQSFSAAPEVAIAMQSAMDGGDGGWAYLYGASPLATTTLSLSIDDDQLQDAERSHTSEQVAYVVFEENVAQSLAMPSLADSQAGKDSLDKTTINDEQSLPTEFALTDVYPNPFNRTVTITYIIADAGDVRIQIYNALVRIIAVLVDGMASEGLHIIAWDGTDATGSMISSGVYLIRFEAGGSISTRSLVHVR